jgi:hypothetical protein
MIALYIDLYADCIKLQEDLESAIKWEQDWLMAFAQEIGMLYLLQILN